VVTLREAVRLARRVFFRPPVERRAVVFLRVELRRVDLRPVERRLDALRERGLEERDRDERPPDDFDRDPRREELFDLASPFWALILFTVRAATSSSRPL
jgi:hypothetical protein